MVLISSEVQLEKRQQAQPTALLSLAQLLGPLFHYFQVSLNSWNDGKLCYERGFSVPRTSDLQTHDMKRYKE